MKAEQIRNTTINSRVNPNDVFLREIAAQLADLNENLAKIAKNLEDLGVTVYKP